MKSSEKSDIEIGIEVIKSHLKTLPLSPGVYRMISDTDEVLYVGKAKALKKRVISYTHFDKLPSRLQKMVSQTRKMEFINTHTQADALILEADLIKKYKPKFNILLRDDKSFPYILIKEDHAFPQILKHRGVQNIKGKYFGPFPSAGDVNRTISILQRVFLLRNCSDSYFANRERPCLQYHIKRCSAPCTLKINAEEYVLSVCGAQGFMEGKSRAVQDGLSKKMQIASEGQDYEMAASYRDRIRALTSIQSNNDISLDIKDADIIAIVQQGGVSCIQVFFYRSSRNLGNRSYFPCHDKNEGLENILSAFIAQFYRNKPVPKNIIVNLVMEEVPLLQEALSCNITMPRRGRYKKAIDFATNNAAQALKRHLALSATRLKMRGALMELFDLDDVPKRIEIYDNSHISGTNMVGAMVVEGEEGFLKKAYRKFNIKHAAASDDYGMMREVLTRRFKRSLDGDSNFSENFPDLLLIDGGLGQLNACRDALEDLGILDEVILVAIAKGEDRNAGREKFFMLGRDSFTLPLNDPVLHYLQRLRDEAHRFAIGSHRARRAKSFTASPLDDIQGIGAKRKKALLLHFGSAKAVSESGIDDLLKVDGISKPLAQKIYGYFNS